jgi:glycosyltransferase involved in cell wall biosynthesis
MSLHLEPDPRRPLRIALLAPLMESVPPRLYGGTERVVHWLAEGLIDRGHEVTLFASGDSSTRARLVPVVERALRLDPRELRDPVALHLLEAEMCRDRFAEFDVVHSHIDYLAFGAFRGLPVPVVATLHGRLDIDGLDRVHQAYRAPLVSISNAQRAPMPAARWAATIYHGLPLDGIRFDPEGGDYAVFLGRMSREKRPDVAIEVARRAGIRLVLAAKVDPFDGDYFEQEIEPLLAQPGVDFIGEVDDERKQALLGKARALLFPVSWPEPFGLAMVEAMACGTPVIACRCGSVPEVIDHGVTGFICDDDDELVGALARAHELDRAACRRVVERRFGRERMAAEYEMLYRRLIARAEPAPWTQGPRSLHHDHVDRADPIEHVDADVVRVASEL